jgi:hypothetical protein
VARRSAPRSSTRRARTKLQAAPLGAPLPSFCLEGKARKAHPAPQTIRAIPLGCLITESDIRRSFSGRAQREPGIHNHSCGVWIPESSRSLSSGRTRWLGSGMTKEREAHGTRRSVSRSSQFMIQGRRLLHPRTPDQANVWS